ncbi:6536_t:CDS:2 [Funneliformis caledonium]|uniref:6536_t:CDS:1 n=1 Tax=Funneliformis caledonium TaxID=1117310 RepID=A0A9N9FI03_9GLOM|nr:6536_t:CDS:2 [Funneliformis caledonium]
MNNPLPQYDYYKALEITPTASSEEIKKAYRKLALKCHPDKHKHDKASINDINNQFILISEAYTVLVDERSRERYDYIRCMGKTPEHEEEVNPLHEIFREIMSKKELINELYESFTNFAVSMCWITNSEIKDKLYSTFEKEISLIESIILNEEVNLCEQTSNENLSDFEFSTNYLPEDDIVQIMESPQWILIDKEILIFTKFAESHMLLVESVTIFVYPLMMACTYGTWKVDQRVSLLHRVTALMTKIIQYLEFMNQLTKTDVKEFESIANKMETENIQTHVTNLKFHPIISKIGKGRFGQNTYPLISIAAWLGPSLAGQSLYWTILSVFLYSILISHHNEGDLDNFQQFLDLFEEIISLLDHIKNSSERIIK